MRRGIGRAAGILLVTSWVARASLPGASAAEPVRQSSGQPEPDRPVFGRVAAFDRSWNEIRDDVDLHVLNAYAELTGDITVKQLGALHPAHRVEVDIRYTVSPTQPPVVDVTFASGVVPPAVATLLKAALMKVGGLRTRKSNLSFSVTYVVRGSDEPRPAPRAPASRLPGRDVPPNASQWP